MSEEFNAKQARENFRKAKPDYQEIYQRILNSVEFNSKKGINPVFMSFSIANISQEIIDELTNKLNQLGFGAKIKKDSASSISVEVSY